METEQKISIWFVLKAIYPFNYCHDSLLIIAICRVIIGVVGLFVLQDGGMEL